MVAVVILVDSPAAFESIVLDVFVLLIHTNRSLVHKTFNCKNDDDCVVNFKVLLLFS